MIVKKYLLVILYLLFLPGLRLLFSAESNEREFTFMDENQKMIKEFTLASFKKNFKEQDVNVYNYVSQKIEIYRAFDLSKILDHVYGRNKWRNSFALVTISTDQYAPFIQKKIYTQLRPYLAFARSDGKEFENKKSFSKGSISLAPYYIIWKSPRSTGNLKKVRDHWPWKINKLFILPNEPKELAATSPNFIAGKKTFLNHCIACHSINGIGGTKGGDVVKLIKTKNLTDEYLEQYILDPRISFPKSKMPRFPIYLDEKKVKIKEVIQYIKDKTK